MAARCMLSLLLSSVAVLRREEIEVEPPAVVALAGEKADLAECSAALATSMGTL